MKNQQYIDLILSKREHSQPLYLLVDPLKPIYDVFPVSMYQLNNLIPQENIAVILRPDLSYTPEECPHLFKIASPGHQLDEQAMHLLDESISLSLQEQPGYKRYICGWLQSNLGIEDLANNITQRLYLQHRGIPKTYPLHEPIRQEIMAYSLFHKHPEFYSLLHTQWLGGISNWFFPTTETGFMHLKGSGQFMPVELPDDVLDDIADTVLAMHALAVWQLQAEKKLSYIQKQQMPLMPSSKEFLPKGAVYKALTTMQRARHKGLTDHNDQTVLAMILLNSHRDFDVHPLVQKSIRAAITKPGTLADQLDRDIPHMHWLHVLQELNA